MCVGRGRCWSGSEQWGPQSSYTFHTRCMPRPQKQLQDWWKKHEVRRLCEGIEEFGVVLIAKTLYQTVVWQQFGLYFDWLSSLMCCWSYLRDLVLNIWSYHIRWLFTWLLKLVNCMWELRTLVYLDNISYWIGLFADVCWATHPWFNHLQRPVNTPVWYQEHYHGLSPCGMSLVISK